MIASHRARTLERGTGRTGGQAHILLSNYVSTMHWRIAVVQKRLKCSSPKSKSGGLLSKPQSCYWRSGAWGAVAESTKASQLSAIEQHHDAAQHTAMSTSQPNVTQHRHVTPPSRSTNQPLTPPLTDKKPFTEASCVIALFRRAQAGSYTEQEPWICRIRLVTQ